MTCLGDKITTQNHRKAMYFLLKYIFSEVKYHFPVPQAPTVVTPEFWNWNESCLLQGKNDVNKRMCKHQREADKNNGKTILETLVNTGAFDFQVDFRSEILNAISSRYLKLSGTLLNKLTVKILIEVAPWSSCSKRIRLAVGSR